MVATGVCKNVVVLKLNWHAPWHTQVPKQIANRMGRTAFRNAVQTAQRKVQHHGRALFQSAIADARVLPVRRVSVLNNKWIQASNSFQKSIGVRDLNYKKL